MFGSAFSLYCLCGRLRRLLIEPPRNLLCKLFYACDNMHIRTGKIRLYVYILNPLVLRMNTNEKPFLCHRPCPKFIENNWTKCFTRKPESNSRCLLKMSVFPGDLFLCC